MQDDEQEQTPEETSSPEPGHAEEITHGAGPGSDTTDADADDPRGTPMDEMQNDAVLEDAQQAGGEDALIDDAAATGGSRIAGEEDEPDDAPLEDAVEVDSDSD